MRRQRALLWLGLGAVLLAVAALAGAAPARSDRPLHPAANGPHGAKAVVVLLRELGADVDIVAGTPASGVTTALLLDDQFEHADRTALRSWVRGGGSLVVADPTSPLEADGDGCPPGIDGVEELSLGPGPSGSVRRGEQCFDGFVRSEQLGRGRITTIANPQVLDNEHLATADNSVLAADLLAPSGSEHVAFLLGRSAAGGEQLVDLLGPRAAQTLGQLAIAFGIYLLWKGRRLGRPVLEPQPVTIAGSELVAAVGRMLASRRRPEEVAATVRADVRRGLDRRLGIPPDAPLETLVTAVAARTGLDPAWLAGVLALRPVVADADLVDLLTDLDRVRTLALAPGSSSPTVAGGTR